jgi:(R)-2-hydroxyacyl-CoA dehydratese activating ATPase
MTTAGVDVGSTATKAVVFDGSVLGEALLPTGWNPWEAGLQALGSALQQAGVAQGDLRAVVVCLLCCLVPDLQLSLHNIYYAT